MSAPLRVLLAVVLLGFILSSGMVGFLLGRNAAHSTGELLDTIVLSPGQVDPSLQNAGRHYFAGILQDAEGAPISGLTVQLKGYEIRDLTDEQGKFLLMNLPSGEYTLEALDNSGEPVASIMLYLMFSDEEEIAVELGDGTAVMSMPEQARLLELSLTVNGDSSLAVNVDTACFATSDGQIVNFRGEALPVQEGAQVLTAGGNLVDSEGYITLLSKRIVITPQGTWLYLEELEASGAAEIVTIEEDDRIILAKEVVLEPDGEIVLPDGQPVKRESVAVIIAEDRVMEITELPEKYEPPVVLPEGDQQPGEDPVEEQGSEESEDPQESPVPSPSVRSAPRRSSPRAAAELEPEPESSSAEAVEEESSEQERGNVPDAVSSEAAEAMPEPTSQPDPIAEPTVEPTAAPDPVLRAPAAAPTVTPTPTPAPTPSDDFAVWDEDNVVWRSADNALSWEQRSTINLFKDRNAPENELPEYAPGASGYYLFHLRNAQDFDVSYTLSFQEQAMHLPLRFSVTNAGTNKSYLYRQRVPEGKAVTSTEVVIPANSTQTFRIDWEWPYEDWFRADLDNEIDTAAGSSSGDHTYLLAVTLSAEQVVPVAPTPTPAPGTKYPGRR